MKQSEHLERLQNRILRFKRELIALKETEVDRYKRPGSDKWNADECFKHLVVMWELYRAQIDTGLTRTIPRKRDRYNSGWYGAWFAGRMRPVSGGGTRTFSIFEPHRYQLQQDALDRLIEVQDEMLNYLDKLKNADISRMKVTSPASKLVRFKMGDALEIILNHQDRHWNQALRAMEQS